MSLPRRRSGATTAVARLGTAWADLDDWEGRGSFEPRLAARILDPPQAGRRTGRPPPGPSGYSAALVWRPSANSSIILRQNAGRSSGRRDVTRPWSVTTVSSTQLAPALLRSALSEGHEVMRRPLTPSASISVQGPWQIAAIGLPDRAKARTNAIAFGSRRRASGLITPPGRTRPS